MELVAVELQPRVQTPFRSTIVHLYDAPRGSRVDTIFIYE